MSNEVTNLKDTIIPKSDQLNADQLLGGDMTILVTSVRRGDGAEQPVVIGYENDGGRPYKPCKSMRKVLIFAWGEDGNAWVGRSMTLFNKQDVKWGGVAVGGIRISHLSHIDRDIQLSLAETKGKKAPIIVKRLDVSDPTIAARAKLDAAARSGMEALKSAWTALNASDKNRIGPDGCPPALKAIAQKADADRERANQAPAQAEPPKPEPTSEPDPAVGPHF